MQDIQDLIKRQVSCQCGCHRPRANASLTLISVAPSPSATNVYVYVDRSQVSFVPPAEVDTEVRSGQFVGPIQYRIWKHMKSSLYPSMLNYVSKDFEVS